MEGSPSFKAKLLDAQKTHSRGSVTLRKCINADRDTNPLKTPKFIMMMESIEMAIRALIQYNERFSLIQLYFSQSVHNKPNSSGSFEEKTSEDLVLQCLKASGLVCYAYSSASKKVLQLCDDHASDERYLVAFNPMEGSRQTLVTGFIFSVYRQSEITQRSHFKPGNEIIIAGFVVFGAACELFISTGGNSLQEFIYDEVIGEFIAQDLEAKIPVKGKFYCIDEAQSEMWDQPTFEFVTSKKNPKIGPPKQYRCTGSLCTDMYACLKEGGILMYPKTLHNPTGTVKLLFEANPLAYIARAAGGLATTGYASPLDIVPESLHQTVPLYMGAREEVVDLLENVTIRIATNS